jgi:hypothetical protein
MFTFSYFICINTKQILNPGQLNLLKIAAKFVNEAAVASIQPYGSGHINDTYYVKNHDFHDFLLQRINHNVFKDIPALMNNISLVLAHMRKKLKKINGAEPDKELLSLVLTHDHHNYYLDEQGNYWRMYKYIGNTRSIDIVETRQQAFEGGKAIGNFQALLFDLDSSLLNHTIPDFHHIGNRLAQFNAAILADPLDRKKTIISEIEFIMDRTERMSTILKFGDEGKLPLRITHNDTKFNNILLDEQNRAQCVIDLDTVMPGYVAYDFGDAIRTIINSGSEDEKDLNNIQLNMSLFEAFATGYLIASSGFLTENEIKSLPMGVLLFPYMQGVRFLTDYLNGDIYYKIHFPGHNLQRSRAQLQLLRKLEENYAGIETIIQEIAICLDKGVNTEDNATV